ncbi:MAG: hypothetical protein AB7P67_15230, partial [Vicinamibacterales bacterium]
FRPARVTADGSARPADCRGCHASQHASWTASFHRTMTTEAVPDAARFLADGQPPPSTWGAMRIEPRDGGLWAEFPDPDHIVPRSAVGVPGPGGDRPVIGRAVALITGSHHQQVFWYETGKTRVLGRFPLTYLIGERRWIPRSAAFLQPAAPVYLPGAGQWNQVCISCHTTRGQARVPSMYRRMTPETMSADSRVSEFGIACEACHGPAGPHADVPREVAMTNPRRLDPRRSVDVCGQCHSVWEWHDAAGEQAENTHGPAFRPGDVLTRTRFVARPGRDPGADRLRQLLDDDPGFVREAFWPDGTIAVAGREYNGLIESACFTGGRTPERTMTCLSCHALHQEQDDAREPRAWADDQLSRAGAGDAACLSCHSSVRAGRTEHTRHVEGSAGSRCVSCHMPYTTYGLLKTVRSHRITSPDAGVAVRTGRPDACSLCHVDKPLAWTARRLEAWYGQPVPEGIDGDEPAAIRWALSGDAQQRAVAAEALGRAETRRADDAWVIPALAILLDDPYPAVRFIAARALGARQPDAVRGYDFLAPRDVRAEARRRALAGWRGRAGAGAHVPDAVFDALTARRDDRPVALRE